MPRKPVFKDVVLLGTQRVTAPRWHGQHKTSHQKKDAS
jgi:hypothetical protein